MDKLKHTWHKTPRSARRIIVSIIGGVVILAGIAMLALPGPGWATIFLGLAILATEFDRAEKMRAWVVTRFKDAIEKARAKTKKSKR